MVGTVLLSSYYYSLHARTTYGHAAQSTYSREFRIYQSRSSRFWFVCKLDGSSTTSSRPWHKSRQGASQKWRPWH